MQKESNHIQSFLKAGIILCVMLLSIMSVAAKPADSHRVGKVLKEIKLLVSTVQDSILSNLQGDEAKNLKSANGELKKMLKKSEGLFTDTMLTDFKKLSEAEKSGLKEMEAKIVEMKNGLNKKSVYYHMIALSHIPVYKAVQEMRTDGRMPLLATYLTAYDPNTTTNNQVTLTGAYLNFYLEYRITVGGIEMGPDIVDPDRVVFTFPAKLLQGITEPSYVEVIAAPRKKSIVGGYEKIEDNAEQHTFVLVYPVRK